MSTGAQIVLAPLTGGSTARTVQRLTGTTSQSNSTALTPGKYATLMVSSDAAVAIRFSSSAPTAVATDLEIAASGRFDWYVETDTAYVAVFPADGSSTFECWVWESSVAA